MILHELNVCTSARILQSSLSKNKIGNVTSLGNTLRVNRSLTRLDIFDNVISDAGSIFEALEYNNTLQEL
jgi:hypothetical protein